jgi:RND family efflux transporter MFP subunit
MTDDAAWPGLPARRAFAKRALFDPGQRLRTLGIAAALLAGGLLVFAGTRARSEAPVVSVQRVERGTVRDRIAAVANGRVGASRELVLRAEVGGKVRARRHRRGDIVTEGAPLLALETTELQGRVRLQRAAVAVAKAQAAEASARAALARARARVAGRLAASRATPTVERDTAVAELRIATSAASVAAAVVAEREAALAVSEESLARAELRAPFAGLVLTVAVDEGDLVTPGAPLVTLADVTELHVDAAIDEADMPRARPGMLAELRFEGAPGVSLRRPVSEIAPSITLDERGMRTAAVRIDLAREDRFPVGASVEVDLIVAEQRNALLVPTSALLGSGSEREVFVVHDGTVHRRRVQVGVFGARGAEATRGVEVGDLVVLAARSAELPEGAKVRWQAANPSALPAKE